MVKRDIVNYGYLRHDTKTCQGITKIYTFYDSILAISQKSNLIYTKLWEFRFLKRIERIHIWEMGKLN